MDSIERDDRVLPLTRLVAAVIVPVLVSAFVILYVFPDDTADLWAWPIQPRMSPMMLGATYLGGAWFFARALFARRWHTFGNGMLAESVFVAVLCLATIVHWDKFTHDSAAFILWAGLYLALPVPLLALWWWNRRSDPGKAAGVREMPGGVRVVLALLGVALGGVAVLLFIVPEDVGGLWPWALSPLMARVMAAMFALPSAVSLLSALDGRWSTMPALQEAESVTIGFTLAAIPIARESFDWGSTSAWLFVVGMSAILAFAVWLRVGVLREANRPAASQPAG